MQKNTDEKEKYRENPDKYSALCVLFHGMLSVSGGCSRRNSDWEVRRRLYYRFF